MDHLEDMEKVETPSSLKIGLLRDRRSGNADILLALGLMEECDLIVEGNTANRGASLIALWRAYGPDSLVALLKSYVTVTPTTIS
ncbi:hypothetical protein AtNW77_Chr3g0201461 [Arabidopsis thaliana]